MLPLLLAGGAGALAAKSASSRNKSRPAAYEFKEYSGRRPESPNFLRPVEEQIKNILMARSQGEGVGYAPERRAALLESYDLGRKKDMERSKADINDRLSGMGLSRNLKAVDALYNRAQEDYQTAKDKYVTDVDIEDLERQNEERDVNTARLQDFNTFNFGQQNAAADFDLREYGAENSDRRYAQGSQVERFNQYEDPMGSFIESGLGTYGMLRSPTMGAGGLPENVRPSDALYKPSGGMTDEYSRVLKSPRLRYNLGGR